MKTNLIPFLLTIVFSQLFISISAQNKESFQSNLDSLSYYQHEKVFLHIDRNIYSPGSDIWYKAYLIDDYTYLPSEISNNLHVELISPEGKIIESNITFLHYGFGYGDFHLSDSLPEGQYTIRAYTNFMRNFDDLLFFTQTITVLGLEPIQEPVLVKSISDSIDLQFMPEGGSLIENVDSKVAFKAINPKREPVDFEGMLFMIKIKKFVIFIAFMMEWVLFKYYQNRTKNITQKLALQDPKRNTGYQLLKKKGLASRHFIYGQMILNYCYLQIHHVSIQ